MNCDKWFYLCLAILGVLLIVIIVSYRYNLHLDKKSLKLEANDREHERKHAYNEARIKELEKNNDQIDELKRQILELKNKVKNRK